QHQLTAQSLAKRVLSDERLELGDDVARVAELEVCLNPFLERCRAKFLEPRRVRPRERLALELRQRGAAPQHEPIAQEAGGVVVAALLEREPTVGAQLLETLNVERSGPWRELVAGPSRLQRSLGQQLAQA